MSVLLRNPHSVLAALRHRPQDVLEVRLFAAKPSGAWEDVADQAAARRIPVVRNAVRQEGGRRSRRSAGDAPGRTGTVDEVFSVEASTGSSSGESPSHGVWLALDQLQDPQNVGAIFRSASFFGIRGVLLTRDRSAPLNGTVYDVASGGLESVPFATLPNLARGLDLARKAGLWVLGTSEHAEDDLANVASDRPWLIVVGNEEKGLRRLTLEKCDVVCSVSSRGEVGSLNVSVAAGVLMAALTGVTRPG